MVIDRDRWTVQMLAEIRSQCKQKGMGLCISNPCFELWLIVHYQDLTTIAGDIQELLLANQKQQGQSYAKRYISDLICNENLTDFIHLFPLINTAIGNSQLLRNSSNSNIFDNLGSDVDFIFGGKF